MDALESVKRSAPLLLIRQILVQGMSILVTIFVIKTINREDYGVYSLFNIIFIYSTNLFGIWIVSSLIIKRELDARDLASLKLLFFVISILGIFTSSIVILCFFRNDYQFLILINSMFIYILCISNASLIQVERDRRIDMSLLVKSEVYQGVFFYGFLALGALSKNFLLLLSLAYMARGIIILSIYRIMPRALVPSRVGLYRAFDVIRSSTKLQSFTILNLSKDLFIPIIIGGSMGLGVLAIINWATFIASYPVLLYSSVSRILLPYFIKSTEQDEQYEFEMASFIAGSAAIVMSLPIFFFRSYINVFLFSGAWKDGLVLFAPFIVINYIVIISSIAMSKLQSLNKGYFLIFSGITIFILTIISCIIVSTIKEYSLWGYLNLVTSMSYLVLVYWCCKELGIRVSRYFSRVTLLPILIYVFSIIFIDRIDIFKQMAFFIIVIILLYINMRMIHREKV